MGIFTKVSHKYAKVTRLLIAKVTQKIRKFAKNKIAFIHNGFA